MIIASVLVLSIGLGVLVPSASATSGGGKPSQSHVDQIE